jgi:hypothetical protein
MQTYLLIYVAGVLAGLGRADVPTPEVAAVEFSNQMATFPKRLAGRVLGSLVHKGMTSEQVNRVLWLLPQPLPTVGLLGKFLFFQLRYYDYGLTVFLESDRAGVVRVTSVIFE